MAQRVVVFMDWQNVYKRARAAFCLDGDGTTHTTGQVHPLALAHRICGMKPGRELAGVRIYRGIPTNKADPKGYAANRRQTAAWMQAGQGKLYVHLRPLQYLDGMDPREKGIDVELAIDFVMMAYRKDYDVGILFSVDSDLNPAVDAVRALDNGTLAEVAAWNGPYAPPKRIGASKAHTAWCHWLDKAAFEAVADPQDYGIGK